MNTPISKVAIMVLCIFSILLTGCRGSSGRKVATEALEIIEKKGAAKAGSAIEREAVQIERGAVREAEGYNSGRSRGYRPRHNSYDDEESSYEEPQIYTVQCSQCGGSGAVYMVDYYGNIQYDYYGNPVISQCPSCGGVGSILVSE